MARQTVAIRTEIPALARWQANHRSRPVPAALRRASEPAVNLALRMAQGDPRRLSVEGDGTITVHNRRVW